MKTRSKSLLFFFLILFPAAYAPAQIVQCSDPLLKRIEESLPVFRDEFSYSDTKTMYRGVHEPQFTQESMLQFLFHHSLVYSAGRFITEGNSSMFSISMEGSWSINPQLTPTENEKNYMIRWNAAVKKSSRLEGWFSDNDRPNWKNKSYKNFFNRKGYDLVQFITPSKDYALRYARNGFIMTLEMPQARISPRANPNTSATVTPLLIAPWEVSSVDFENGLSIEKEFQTDKVTRQVNRCLVRHLKIVNLIQNGGKIVGYLSLCNPEEGCTQDQAVMKTIKSFNSEFASLIEKFSLNGQIVRVSAQKP